MARTVQETTVLKATEIRVTSFRGANRQPAGGWVTFSDGKFYGFGLNIEGTEFTFRVPSKGHWPTRYNVSLPKRSKAIQVAIDEGTNVDMSPIKVTLG